MSASRLRRAALAVGAALLAGVPALLAAGSAHAAEGACHGEEARQQSDQSPGTRRPFSTLLPECRAFEMVSPPAAHDVSGINEDLWGAQLAAAPGEPGSPAVAFGSAGGLPSEPPPEGVPSGTGITPYLARRAAVAAECPNGIAPCWVTTSMVAPSGAVSGGQEPNGAEEPIGDFTEALAREVLCNTATASLLDLACVLRAEGAGHLATGAWTQPVGEDGLYEALLHTEDVKWPLLGSSKALTHVVFQAPAGTAFGATGEGIAGNLYELEGLGEGRREPPRLVNVGKNREALGSEGTSGSVSLGGGIGRLQGAVSEAQEGRASSVFFTARQPSVPEGQSATVKLGATTLPAASLTFRSASEMVAATPAGGTGALGVTLETPRRSSAPSCATSPVPPQCFTYGLPVLEALSMRGGPTGGATTVTITGANLAAASEVRFGAVAGTIEADEAGRIVAKSPAGAKGPVNVVVKTAEGESAAPGCVGSPEPPQCFTYGEPVVEALSVRGGPAAGATTVTITGANLAEASEVKFGAVAGAIEADEAGKLVAKSPAGAKGPVNVVVKTAEGESAAPGCAGSPEPPQCFTYGEPVVEALSPRGNARASTVTITGSDLLGAEAVSFGATPARGFTVKSSSEIEAVIPTIAGEHGTVAVTVRTSEGTSAASAAVSAADSFTYGEPVLEALEPRGGPAGGGTAVTIVGRNLPAVAEPSFTTQPNVLYARIDHTETSALSEPEASECTESGCPASYPAGWPSTAASGEGHCDYEERSELTTYPGCEGIYSAEYLGASEDGSKAFFASEQQLVNDGSQGAQEQHLYEYDLGPGPHLHQIAGGRYRGVVAISPDGSHVYFATWGVLRSAYGSGASETGGKTVVGANAYEAAREGQYNLYVFDAAREETRFVARLSYAEEPAETLAGEESLWQLEGESPGSDLGRHRAQSTPDGRFLLFDSAAQPQLAAGESQEGDPAQQVYRYEAEGASHQPTGTLVRVSVGHGIGPGEAYENNGDGQGTPGRRVGLPALIGPPARPRFAAYSGASDWDRAISGDGAYVAFETAEALAPEDANAGAHPECENPGYEQVLALHGGLGEGTGCDVYLWHECAGGHCEDGNAGEVSLISQGTAEEGTHVYPALSASGSDVYFVSRTHLVPEDEGEGESGLAVLYDARLEGGTPHPQRKPCAGEACPLAASEQRETFPFVYSAGFVGPGNVLGAGPPAGPTVTLTGHAAKGRVLILALRTSQQGTVTVSGKGVRKTHARLAAGVHKLRVRMTSLGVRALRRHRPLRLRIALAAAGSTATKTVAVTARRAHGKAGRRG